MLKSKMSIQWYGLVRTFSNHRYDDQTPVTPIPSSNPDLQGQYGSWITGLRHMPQSMTIPLNYATPPQMTAHAPCLLYCIITEQISSKLFRLATSFKNLMSHLIINVYYCT